MRLFYLSMMKKIILDAFTMKLYDKHMELMISSEIHLDSQIFYQILELKITNYNFPVGLIVIRKTNHHYSIDPLIFFKFKTEFETHLKWYALVSPNKFGFENLFYLKQMTNLKVYSFTNYQEARTLVEND